MRRCTACKKDVGDDSQRFCTECGTPLAEAPTISDPNQGTVRMGNEYQTKRMPKKDAEPDIDEMELEFLKMVCAFDSLPAQSIAQSRQLNLQRVRFHLERLAEVEGLIEGFWNADGTLSYNLTQKGRGYLIRKNLL